MNIIQYEERPPAVEAVVFEEKIVPELTAWVDSYGGSIQKLTDGSYYLVGFMHKQLIQEGDMIVRFLTGDDRFLRFSPDEFRARYRFTPIGRGLGIF